MTLVVSMSDVVSDIKKALKHKNYHHWAYTADDGMNKSLKFIIFIIYGYALWVVAKEIWEKMI